jgi:Flp pilus assembly protein CpaB
MTPADDKIKNDSPVEKPPRIGLGVKESVIALAVLLGLIVWAGVMLGKLVTGEQVKRMTAPTPAPTRSKIVSSKELAAYTLLTNDHLLIIPGTNETSNPKVLDDLLDRYLLVTVLAGTEIKSEMLAPREAKELLRDSVAVSIPATATSTLRNQLRVGDKIDLIAVPTNNSSANESQSQPLAFENLLVLDVPAKKDPKPDEKSLAEAGAITLAVPATRRDEFATSIAGATIVITRRVSVR